MSILDISQELMYDFYYNVLKPKSGTNIELCYRDMDFLIYNIKTEDFYQYMKTIINHIDTFN